MQLDDSLRGFSHQGTGPLDMRMSANDNSINAYDVVNGLSESELVDVISKYGEEPNAKQISKAIVNARNSLGNIESTTELCLIVESAFSSFSFKTNKITRGQGKKDKLGRRSNLATQTFQAIRTFVNDEYNQIDSVLTELKPLLKFPSNYHDLNYVSPKVLPFGYQRTARSANNNCHINQPWVHEGQSDIDEKETPPIIIYPPLLAVISFQSLEDRIVKSHFRDNPSHKNWDKLRGSPSSNTTGIDWKERHEQIVLPHRELVWHSYNKHVIEPSFEEITENPRSRSAKLRTAYLSVF